MIGSPRAAGPAPDVPAQLAGGVRRGRRSPLGRALARTGLASRAVVYGALATVVVQVALGRNAEDADQAGGLTALGTTATGRAVLWLLVAGVGCYLLWRLSEAVAGPSSGEDTLAERIKAAVEGIAYVPIGVISVSIAAGEAASAQQGDRYRVLSARVMADVPAGRWLVAAVGLVVLGLGCYLASEGPRRSFRDDLRFRGHGRVERVVVTLGVVGCTARGAVFALAGVLVVAAAVTVDPAKAGGIDAAVPIAGQSYGPVLLIAAAAGIASDAAFAVGEAVWRRI